MKKEINIVVQIYPKEKVVYMAEESSSGASYKFDNINDLTESISFYLNNYYKNFMKNQQKIAKIY